MNWTPSTEQGRMAKDLKTQGYSFGEAYRLIFKKPPRTILLPIQLEDFSR
jgi:hypothetical protein